MPVQGSFAIDNPVLQNGAGGFASLEHGLELATNIRKTKSTGHQKQVDAAGRHAHGDGEQGGETPNPVHAEPRLPVVAEI